MPETDLRLEAIAVRLTQTIPAPAKRIPRPQKSWRTLKYGDRLAYKGGAISPWSDLPPGHGYVVVHVDSLGMTLAKCHIDFMVSATDPVLRWEDPDWQQSFTKLPKPRKKKKK